MCIGRGWGIFLILVVLIFNFVENWALSKWIVFAAALLLLLYEASIGKHISKKTMTAKKK